MSIDLDAPIDGTPSVEIVEIETQLVKLEQMLVARDPDFKNLLNLTHKNLAKNPELAHLLKPEQINTYIKASSRFTQVTIVMDNARKKSTKITDVSVDDL